MNQLPPQTVKRIEEEAELLYPYDEEVNGYARHWNGVQKMKRDCYIAGRLKGVEEAERYRGNSIEQNALKYADITAMISFNSNDGHPHYNIDEIRKSYIAGATSEAQRNRELEKELNDLNEWKEAAMKVFNAIDLQQCSKVLNLPLGSDIAKQIFPSIQKLTAEAQRARELVECIKEVEGTLAVNDTMRYKLQQALKNYNQWQ